MGELMLSILVAVAFVSIPSLVVLVLILGELKGMSAEDKEIICRCLSGGDPGYPHSAPCPSPEASLVVEVNDD